MKNKKYLRDFAHLSTNGKNDLDQVIEKYLVDIQFLNSESARALRFALLLKNLFELQPNFIEDYVAGVEKYLKIKEKDFVLRGKADELFGNIIIEFERDLTEAGKQAEAENQLKKYVACLWSQEPVHQRTRYLCLATDGVRFTVYTPVLDVPNKTHVAPEDVRLKTVERLDAKHLQPPREFYFWLDRYLLRREKMPPRSENIVKDFGLHSHAFQVTSQILLTLWESLKERPDFSVVYETWAKYLRIVYGSPLADDELFIRHTYLAMLAKLMAWTRLAGERGTPDEEQIQGVMEGRFFKDQGIENFLEEDFFSWLVRGEARKIGTDIARMLLGLLYNYDLQELSEDVLKSLYQELVDPKTRHDLGEYYTPDWLAARIVKKLLGKNRMAHVLDPACGSGTFLYQTIREKRRLLGDSADTLAHIQEAVVGVDIHPLAVIVAKTNYVLALGDLLRKRQGKIAIPVYLANSLRLPEYLKTPKMEIVNGELRQQSPGYQIEVDGQIIYIPEKLIEQPTLYDETIEAAREFAIQWAGRVVNERDFSNYLAQHHPILAADEELANASFAIAGTLLHFIEAQRDTIWAFVLKNAYKPLFLKGRFDIVVGNPPWLSYRYVEQLDYQKFLKEQIIGSYRLLSGKAELITHMELGTLFLIRAADLYLKEGGTIAFVLPRSIFSADQHDALRQGTFQGVQLEWTELWDLTNVKPLFNVPACVVFGLKTPKQILKKEINGEVIFGQLPRRNASLLEAEEALKVEHVQFFLNHWGKRSFWSTTKSIHYFVSPYKKRFFQGATIVPRSFWFVEIAPSPLGFDPSLPPVVTSQQAREQAKDAYRSVILKGNVESRFLYATLLSTDLLPFGHLDYRLVVLPIEPEGDHFRLLTSDQARRCGYIKLAEWLEKAQLEWQVRRGVKGESMDIYERLDRVHGLTRQNPQAPYRVLYPMSATYICACLVPSCSVVFEKNGQIVQVTGFVVDYKTYAMETENEEEAYYLVAILNAPIVDRLIKPMQSRGLWGPRDICKKVLELPIPQFDPSLMEHRRLANLGRVCSARVAAWLESGSLGKTRNVGQLRAIVRQKLQEELGEIDELVARIMRTFVGEGFR